MALLVIRDSQLQAFSHQLRQQFIEQQVARVRALLDADEHTGQDLKAWVELAIARAATFGLAQEGDVVRFIDYMVTYGPHFAVDIPTAWAASILQTQGVSAAWKLNRLDEAEPFERSTTG